MIVVEVNFWELVILAVYAERSIGSSGRGGGMKYDYLKGWLLEWNPSWDGGKPVALIGLPVFRDWHSGVPRIPLAVTLVGDN